MLNPIVITGTNLPDVWFQTLYKIIEVGRDFTIDEGSFKGQIRKEYDYITIHSKCPGVGELLPKLNPALQLDDPVAQNYLDNYLPYLMTGEEAEGEAYTYGQRICAANADQIFRYTYESMWIDGIVERDSSIQWYDEEMEENKINQLELMIWTYRNKGYRNNQMILQVGQPSDMLLKDPPCLRHIDTRIQNNVEKEKANIFNLFKEAFHEFPRIDANVESVKKDILGVATDVSKAEQRINDCKVMELHFYPYFRSWDIWGGLPANLAAIELMKQYAASEIGVENGEIIACSKGLHLYSYVFEIAELVRGKTSQEFKNEIERK